MKTKMISQNKKIYILVYLCISIFECFFQNKQILISTHAIKRARERNIAFPDQVYNTLKCGKIFRFGKNEIKFVKKSKFGSIICIGVELKDTILIKTIERGN